MLSMILAFFLLILPSTHPKLETKGNTFTVTFEKGAVWANVAYKLEDRTVYDNYQLSETQTSLSDVIEDECKPCTFKVGIGYTRPDPNNPGVTLVDYIDSNEVVGGK